MNRNIPNQPHHTPEPEKPHPGEVIDATDFALVGPGAHANPAHSSGSRDDLSPDETSYDSCFDDVNLLLSKSMQQPEPDPYLESAGAGIHPGDGTIPESGRDRAGRGTAPRTSEIFRAVATSGGVMTAGGPTRRHDSHDTSGEVNLPGLDITERRTGSSDSPASADRRADGAIPWGQITLLSYSSALTLGLIWMFWTGRIPRGADPPRAVEEAPAVDSARRPAGPNPSSPAPPLPPENIVQIGKSVWLDDLEVTPLSIEATPVELVRTIDPHKRRRQDRCLVLRLRLTNRSGDRSITPLDSTLVRERDLWPYDPYIIGSGGESIRLFPLAIDSEWSIHGQSFPELQPCDSAETLIAAEPGSADRLVDEMTWRVRLRIGAYRSDMLGVRFTRSDVRRPPFTPSDDDE
jgi:hypothetical protein